MIIKMLKGIIIFGAGVYTGVYIAQNYEVDKVEEPKVLFEKAQSYVKSVLEDIDKKGNK